MQSRTRAIVGALAIAGAVGVAGCDTHTVAQHDPCAIQAKVATRSTDALAKIGLTGAQVKAQEQCTPT